MKIIQSECKCVWLTLLTMNDRNSFLLDLPPVLKRCENKTEGKGLTLSTFPSKGQSCSCSGDKRGYKKGSPAHVDMKGCSLPTLSRTASNTHLEASGLTGSEQKSIIFAFPSLQMRTKPVWQHGGGHKALVKYQVLLADLSHAPPLQPGFSLDGGIS